MITRTYPVWRRAADLPVFRALGDPFRPDTWSRIEFRSRDCVSWPLDLDDFTTGASDYGISSDEIYCPCDVALHPWDGSAGDMLRMIYDHCATAGHPKPRYEP